MQGMTPSRLFAAAVAACLALGLAFAGPARAQGAPRIALVVGNAQYPEPLATAANDAGLVAETLRGAGFDVTGAANLDQESLRRALKDFLDKAAQAGPDAIAFVYLAGRGLQYEGENYYAPVDAVLARESDIPLQAIRISDYTRALAALPLRARIVVLDAARGNHFAPEGHLAGGLALVDAEKGSLYAFNAAPGTIAPDEPGPYGAYAQALSELLRQGGVPIDVAFDQVRLRVNQTTRGAVTPWDAANIAPPLILLEAAPNGPAAGASVSYATLQSRPIRSFPANEAYAAALERDTMQGYEDFLAAYPGDPLAGRVRALLAARREALTWRRTLAANTPDACWSYMQRYPKGPHYYDARRRLRLLSAPLEPPPEFDAYDFGGLPPPPEVEYVIVDRPVIIFDPGIYPPPPPPPLYFLPPPPEVFVSLPPPPPPPGPGFLPIPIPIPIPFGRHDGPQGQFNQPNFGQQAPLPASAPGAPAPVGGAPQGGGPAGRFGQAPGQPGQPPLTQPAPTTPPAAAPPGVRPGAPAATPPGAPVQALPQGTSLPPVPARPAAPGAVPRPAPNAPAGAPVGGRPAHPGAPVAPGAGPASPNPAPPQGTNPPPAPAGASRAGTPPVGAAVKPAATAAPDHALPQGTALPPVPGRPSPAAKPAAPGSPAAPSAAPGVAQKPVAPLAPKAAVPVVPPKAKSPPAEPRTQAAPQPHAAPPQPQPQFQRPQPAPPQPAQQRPVAPPSQAQRPQPQVQRPPQPQPPRPQPQPQQAQPKPPGKPPARPGQDPNHP
jgi:uncharacterized caspase-like protein